MKQQKSQSGTHTLANDWSRRKSESSTFGELKEKLEELRTNIRRGCSNLIAEYIGEVFRKKLDKEIDNQQIGQNQLGIEKKTKLILEDTKEYKTGIREIEKEVLRLKNTAEETMQTLETLTEVGNKGDESGKGGELANGVLV